jgi:hypothetical protein
MLENNFSTALTILLLFVLLVLSIVHFYRIEKIRNIVLINSENINSLNNFITEEMTKDDKNKIFKYSSDNVYNPFVGDFIYPYIPGTTPIYSITFNSNGSVIFNQELIKLCKTRYNNFDYYASNLKYDYQKVNDDVFSFQIYSNDGVKTINMVDIGQKDFNNPIQCLEVGSRLLYLNNQILSNINFRKTTPIN